MLSRPPPSQIEGIVHEKIRAAATAHKVGRLHGTEKLNASLGLSSLDLAFLVAELDAQLRVDPFAKLFSITSMRTVNDLVRAYQQAVHPELRGGAIDPLSTAIDRARKRRTRRDRR
jgi:acyl carrier protein